MWVLVIVILVAGEPYSTTKMESYETKQECESEMVRIEADMSFSYPTDHDWRLECRPPKDQKEA